MTAMVHDAGPGPGFEDPVLEGQATFRAALHAMAHPGRVVKAGGGLAPPRPLHPATAALALSLLDMDTPLWLDAAADAEAVRSFFAFHCGCPIAADPGTAAFAIVAASGEAPGFSVFDLGSDEAPDRSATLIVQAERFRLGHGRRLAGPGIDGELRLGIDGVPDRLWTERAALTDAFPRGLDLFITAGVSLVAVPRTTFVGD